MRAAWIIHALPALFCLLALFELPYGYYQFLRITVTVASLWTAYKFYKQNSYTWSTIFGLIAIIYNPVFKIHMERDTHAAFNVATAAIMLYLFWKDMRKNK
jgi:hypothetical protein